MGMHWCMLCWNILFQHNHVTAFWLPGLHLPLLLGLLMFIVIMLKGAFVSSTIQYKGVTEDLVLPRDTQEHCMQILWAAALRKSSEGVEGIQVLFRETLPCPLYCRRSACNHACWKWAGQNFSLPKWVQGDKADLSGRVGMFQHPGLQQSVPDSKMGLQVMDGC